MRFSFFLCIFVRVINLIMKINKMSLDELNTELNRAKFWVKTNPVVKSLDLINKMENKKLELISKNLRN